VAKSLRSIVLPSVSEDGMFLGALQRYMPQVVGVAFEHAGGQDRFNHWADKNYDEFAKTFLARFIPKQVDVSAHVTVEDLLSQADVIEGEARVVEGIDPEDDEP
jgi:hypothetical protein